ncbi:hypothetical protein MNV49_006955 [Pseudohyphozyma bogoriensis]|nr:hypothetical protein MNV49_006955 [Pseudohyphozyma bogoriensis]
MATPQSYTISEVNKHSKEGDLWVVVNNDVYDLSRFADAHPGGSSVLFQQGVAGKDASESFFSLHRSEVLTKYARLKIGTLDTSAARPYLLPVAGELSPVPFAEPAWLSGKYHSPYLKDSHKALQKEMRKFFDGFRAEARERETSGEKPSREVMEKMGSKEWEINAMRMGPGPHLKGRKLPGGVKPEEFDYFHEMVVIQELPTISSGLPPVLNFGSDKMKAEVLPDILSGKKFISLAISEAQAGSDVRGMTTWATKTADGKFYEVTGTKKWITTGMWSDYFMTGVRTSTNGLSMLLIPRTDNVSTKRIKTSYSAAAGTAFVEFDKALVPVENLLGKENEGLKVILSNFNHERIVICARIARYSRLIYEESFKYAHLRKVFGKPLVEQPVIRAKFALMLAKVDAGQAWLESLIYQMTKMTYAQQAKELAGPIALLKMYLSRCAGEISDDAVQIWGGRGITQGGMGVYIEQFQKTFKFDSILGGSEEVLADLGTRQAMKGMPKVAL